MIDATQRAIDTWERILRKPASVALLRGNQTLSDQTVRITFDNPRSTARGDSGGQYTDRVGVIYGVKDHPTVADTNIKAGDRFAVGTTIYEVMDVMRHPGAIHASFVRTTS